MSLYIGSALECSIHCTKYSLYQSTYRQTYTALLWQKEASDIPSKFELSIPRVLFFQAKLYTQTLILLRDVLDKTSQYSTAVNGNERYILLFL